MSEMRYFVLTYTHKIGQIDGFKTEQELDKFAFHMTSFTEDEMRERLAEGNQHGPPIVFALMAGNLDKVFENNYERPFAIYLRGERYDCMKRKGE